jgi:hypothetical protein
MTISIRFLLVFFSFFIVKVNVIPAATVSVLVIEIGSTGNTGIAGLWETGIMDVLFDMGHIVSNAPVLRVPQLDEGEMPAEARHGFEEADINGVDYFIIAELSYPKIEKTGIEKTRIERPYQVELKLYKTNPYSILYNKKYAAAPDTPLSEEISNAKDAARMLVPYLRGGL